METNPTIVYLPIEKLKFNSKNPRTIKDEQFKRLIESVRSFPKMLEKRPIVIDEEFTIFGGNRRYLACKEAGLKEVPVIIADDWTEEEKSEFIIRDNISAGEWDYDMLQEEWNQDQLQDWGLDIDFIGVDTETSMSTGKEFDSSTLGNTGTLVFRFPYDIYLRALDMLANAQEKTESENNEETLLKLLQEYE